jgi:uncharacterized protein YbaR (Trm112 family)/SAM-dependent methyltransferase
MRYSLLNFIGCPETRSELICIVTREQPGLLPHVRLSECKRINSPGAVVGPLPANAGRTPVTELLGPHSGMPAEPARNMQVRIREGLLIAPDTGRWYPVRNFVPELLPDHLRDFDRDFEFLATVAPSLPPGLFDILNRRSIFTRADRKSDDAGLSHKVSEMTLAEKVTDPHFFGPGYIAPFNPGATEHTLHLVRLFTLAMPLFLNGSRRVILDCGSGYSWTTEWMLKMGFEPIGFDLTRIYLDIAVARLGDNLPCLAVADIEHLPLRDGILDGVLGYEAFHHIPDRKRAMKEFCRTLKSGGIVVLAEPNAEHEHVPAVQDVATKYGILEKGMDLVDVQSYVEGTGLANPVQHYIIKTPHTDAGAVLTTEYVRRHAYTPSNIFTIEKQ